MHDLKTSYKKTPGTQGHGGLLMLTGGGSTVGFSCKQMLA